MDHTAHQDIVDSEIPVPYGVTRGGRVGLVVGYLLLAAFTAVAISHLTHPRTTGWVGLIAAGIWMLMVGASLWATCDDDGGCGLVQFLINRLGAFAGRQFAQFQRPAGQSPVVGFGYWIGRHRFYYFQIPISGIDEVHWSSGQATALAGRDMDDWLVCIWYDTGSVIARFGRSLFRGGQGVYCLGESGPKEKTAEFGRRLVAFLREGGADLVEMDEGKYVRRESAQRRVQLIPPA